jgi:polysaccharide chain length determinant protein (PEP-CTERM system associated)
MTHNYQDTSSYVAIIRRRKWHMLVPGALVFSLAVVLAVTLPAVYRSTATLLIERQQIPDELVFSTVTGYAAEQIQVITQQVMTYDNLWKIAEELDLYPEERGPESADEIVGRIHERVSTEMLSEDVVDPRTGRPREVVIAFAVSFDNESPAVAQRVAGKLAELYLEENRKIRTERAAGTSTFLAAEAERLNAQIVDLEARLAEFKRNNSNLLPEFAGVNREFLERVQGQYEDTQASIRSLESRKSILQKQLTQIAGGSEDRVNAVRLELAAAREKYSDIHPDVKRLKRALAALEAEPNSGQAPGLATQSAEIRTTMLALQSELETVVANLRGERVRLGELDEDITNYGSRLARAPEVEQEYLALTRDYDNAVRKYAEMKNKEMSARLAEELERAQKGERLSLLAAPRLPTDPIKPNRLGFVLLGILLAMMAGVGVAAVAEFSDHTIHDIGQLVAVLRTQPIGVIPVIGEEGNRAA